MFINWLPHWEGEGMVELQVMRLSFQGNFQTFPDMFVVIKTRYSSREVWPVSGCEWCGDRTRCFWGNLWTFPAVFVETKPGYFLWEVRLSLAVFVVTELGVFQEKLGTFPTMFVVKEFKYFSRAVGPISSSVCGDRTGYFLRRFWDISSCVCGDQTYWKSGQCPAVLVGTELATFQETSEHFQLFLWCSNLDIFSCVESSTAVWIMLFSKTITKCCVCQNLTRAYKIHKHFKYILI